MKISPSILSADFTRLGEQCRTALDAGADMIHFDVMDGHFVENISFGLPVLRSLRKGLGSAVLDVHLMITHPLKYAPAFLDAGADLLTFHVETEDNIDAVLDVIHAAGRGAGLSVSPNTPAEAVFPWLDRLALVLVMGVEPGQGGQSFDPRALDKLRTLRAECARRGIHPDLSVDGGVKLGSTAPQCAQAGATLLVAGSAVFCAPDIARAVREFRQL
ncbi:MAG: ribulose-phosphate 3-epimerase [Clostridiales bacterium]|nr:ribulose-phosphate 3-epimerase [Clostridiales bacterium]MCD8383621.1 ribulose-phosphate 3-epimerase [Clostridiales bacterium]